VNDDDDASDDHSHGTFVAGLAAAETDNGIGISGVAWNCSILPVKSMDEEGEGLYSWVIQGIDYAVEQGVQVINLSLGGDVPSEALETAVRDAYLRNIPVISSVGNDSEAILYPAAYDAYVLAVAATDYNDVRPEWSNTGPEVDVAAPGDLVISSVPTWYFGPGSIPYGVGSGTSFACPHVAGLAALLLSHKTWLSVDEIYAILRYTAEDVNAAEHPGMDDYIGYGRINMDTALVPIKIKN
jgi:subtilisin family serine protease